MSLIDYIVVSTLEDAKSKTKHSLLMEFYSLDRRISLAVDQLLNLEYNSKEYKQVLLSSFFLKAKAKTILKALNII